MIRAMLPETNSSFATESKLHADSLRLDSPPALQHAAATNADSGRMGKIVFMYGWFEVHTQNYYLGPLPLGLF